MIEVKCSADFTLAARVACLNLEGMFTIEHEFDATIITLVDEGGPPLQEDVTVQVFEDSVAVEQFDPRSDQVLRITFSQAQLRDLAAAMNLPEGVYRLRKGRGG